MRSLQEVIRPDGMHRVVSVSVFHSSCVKLSYPRFFFFVVWFFFFSSDGKPGMKRNPLGMADMSAAFRGAVRVVHVS